MKTEKEFQDFNERMVQKYGPHKYHGTKVSLIRFAEEKKKKLLRASLGGKRRGVLLDIGCGSCDVSQGLDFQEKVGLDLSSFILKIASEKSPGTNLVQGNAECLPFPDDSFSCIMLTDVLEHVLRPETVLKEIHRVAEKDAFVIINVPNDRLINRCKKLLKMMRLDRMFVTEYHFEEEKSDSRMEWHLHEFSADDIKEKVKALFIVQALHPIPFFFAPFQYLFVLKPLKK
jgi:ubiquinone/menaquinone biosynthesis C-methylase UbiE